MIERVCRICGGPLPPGHRVLCSDKCRRRAKVMPSSAHRGADGKQEPAMPARPWRHLRPDEYDHSIVIYPKPLRVKPLKRYPDGKLMPYQDDLRAAADHGSPGRLPAPDGGWARASAIAGAT